jgi:serine/threonine-protein kinase
LKHAHDSGVVHRDIKLSNLLLDRHGRVKLSDFGVAKVFTNTRLTATNAVVGTAEYLSPEQASGKPVTRQSDLYSLGVVLYVLLTGRPPFRGSSPAELMRLHLHGSFDAPGRIVQDLPHDLDALIAKLLAKNPEDRPADAQALTRELQRIQRKYAGRSQATSDVVRFDATQADSGARSSSGSAAASAPPARRLLYEDDDATGRGRRLGRIVFLLLALAGIGALIVWGTWPKPAEAYLKAAEEALAAGDFDQAADQLDRLERKHADHAHKTRVAEMRKQIETERQLKRAGGVFGSAFKPPSCDAERFYREAQQEYQAGQIDKARAKWRNVVTAYKGVAGQEAWVKLAERALETSAPGQKELEVVQAAIDQAKKEPKDEALARLRALADLYAHRDDDIGKQARNRIAKALAGLLE